MTSHALAWLGAVDRARPFFFLVHYLDPHSDYSSLPEYEREFVRPYEGPATGKSEQLFEQVSGLVHFTPADAQHLSDLYDAGVRQQDAELEKLFGYLASAGFLADTLVVLVSDHGEEFLEHGGVLHGLAQYEESVRVPFLLWGPDVPHGVRVTAPVSLVDVLPTVLDVLGVQTPPGVDGRSLRALWEQPAGQEEARPLFVEADLDPPGPTARSMVPGDDLAVRQGKYKLVLDPSSGTVKLFDLAVDPHETKDVASAHPEVVGVLRGELERFRKRPQDGEAAEPMSKEDLEKLQGLGYAGKD